MLNLKEFLGLNYYVSELDQFLSAFDKTHLVKSATQHQEIKKYTRIFHLRDHCHPETPENKFWDSF